MTTPTPEDGTLPLSPLFFFHLAKELATVTAERDQARQMLADVWDEGVSFGWHSTDLRTDENPYRKAGL